jgi:hypothetical protein
VHDATMRAPTYPRTLIIGVVLSLGMACGGAERPATQPTGGAASTTPSTVATSGPPVADPSPEPEGVLGLVIGNVASTDLSALVTITSARIEGPNGAPPASTGYVNHVYVVDVVTCINGCGNAKSFTVAEMAEAGLPTKKVGAAMVVSACRSGSGKYYTPDVGYLIPASELPASTVADLAAKPPPRASSVCTP